MTRLDWRVVSLAAGLFLVITYTLCVAYDLLFGQHMYEAWLRLLPGFSWISWGSFFLGLLETFLYGVYVGLVFVPLYNFFQDRMMHRRHGD